MKYKLAFAIICIIGTCIGGFIYYNHYYVKTLMLSEIVERSDNPLINIAVKITDFDTGLTRRDISKLKKKKDYWIARMEEVELMSDLDAKAHANSKLISDMIEDPTMKKICNIILGKGLDFSIGFLQNLLI